MQAHVITVFFPTSARDHLVHQIRNFAEDLWTRFRGTRLATVENMDTATDKVYVHVGSSGRLRQVTKIIEQCLNDHLLQDRSSIEVSS